MDPNVCLAEIREILAKEPANEDYSLLRELVQSLDEWLSSGGFPPAAWITEPPDSSEALDRFVQRLRGTG